MEYDVIVVGGGASGLMSALALSKEGKKVLVLEKNHLLGNNLRTYTLDGYTVDTGLHAITHVDDGPLMTLMRDYFEVIPKFLPFGDYHVRTREKLVVFPWTMQAWMNFDTLPQKDRILITGILGQSLAFSILGTIDKNQSIYDFLKANDFSRKTWKFIDTMSYFMSGRSMRETPVWRLIKGARYMEENQKEFIGDKVIGHIASFAKLLAYDGSYHQAYPASGVGVIVDCMLKSMPRGRVTIRTGEEVVSINGSEKATGVSTDRDSYNADAVVYSGFVKDLPNLTKSLPRPYVRDLHNLKQTTSITVWLGLDRRLREFNYTGSEIWFEEGKPYWGMPTSNYNESFAPAGGQIAGFTSIVDEDARADERKLLESVYTAIPRLEDHVEFKHVQVTVPEKAAVTVGSKFPTPKSPLDGLYLVGTDTDTRSMGVTRAAYSVLEMLQNMRKDGILQERPKKPPKKHAKSVKGPSLS